MRIQIQFLVAALSATLSGTAIAQGTFQNLNFELSTVSSTQTPSPPGVPTVDIAIALPGWSVVIGTNQANLVMYNSQTLDTSAVSIFRTNHPVEWTSLHVIEGTFSVFLMGGVTQILSTYIRTDTSLMQTGLIPANARSIQFKTAGNAIVVSLDGQTLSSVPLEVTPQYVLRAADVTPFMGQIKELKFTIFSSTTGGGGISGILDSITFSPEPIPEPSTFGLFGLGALLLCSRLRTRRRS